MSKSKTIDDAVDQLQSDEVHLPATIERNERRVRRGFWKKIVRVAAFLPFLEDLLAAYYCARDRETPTRVRAVLLAALAYFVLPVDAIPDFIAAFGFTDDAAVLMTAIGLVSAHLKPAHREKARDVLDGLAKGSPPPSNDI